MTTKFKKVSLSQACMVKGKRISKHALAQVISESFDMTLDGSIKVVSKIFDTISEKLIKKDRITVVGFGSFYPVVRKRKRVLHPISREELRLPDRHVAAFKPSRRLKQMMANPPERNCPSKSDSQPSHQNSENRLQQDQEGQITNIDQFL